MVKTLAYTYNKLRGRIVEKYGSLQKFSKELGISMTSVSKKMNCHTGFSQDDIEEWANLLDIDFNDYPQYFFA